MIKEIQKKEKGKKKGNMERRKNSRWIERHRVLVICKEEDCRLYFCLFAIRWATGGAEGVTWS